MRYEYKHLIYPPDFDKVLRNVCDALNCIPGITTTGSCCGHGTHPISIFFSSRDPIGTFFIARCTSRRYWHFGHEWTLTIPDCSDRYPHATFCLESTAVGDEAYAQADSLAESILTHINHEVFIKGFKIDLRLFNLKEEIS